MRRLLPALAACFAMVAAAAFAAYPGPVFRSLSVLGNLTLSGCTGYMVGGGGGPVTCSGVYPGQPIVAAGNHVANLSALKSAATGSYTTIVRDGYAFPNDGGAATYTYSATNCSLNSGAGDNGFQVQPNAGGGCWVLSNTQLSGADVRIWGCLADGVTDAGVCISTASADFWNVGTLVIPPTYSGFYIASPAVVLGTVVGTSWRPISNLLGGNTYPGTSWLKCAATVNPCLQRGTVSGSYGPTIENLVVAGPNGVPNSGSVGMQVVGNTSYTNSRNIYIVNFDTCAKWGPEVQPNSIGIASHEKNLIIGGCHTHFFVNDGYPELYVDGGRAGVRGDYTTTQDFVYQTLSSPPSGGGGPNGVNFVNYQFNTDAAGAVACGFRWGGWTGWSHGAGFQGETRISDGHVEWHVGSGPLFCSDSTVPIIQQLFVHHEVLNGPGVAFAFDPATVVGQAFFDDTVFNCASMTLTWPNSSLYFGASAYQNVHFNHVFGCGTTTFNGGTGSAANLSLTGNVWGSLNLSGYFYQLEESGDEYNHTLSDTATGFVGWKNSTLNTWTPALAFSGGGSVTYSTHSGTWTRTANGGLHARWLVVLSGVSSPSGNVSITGFPKNCLLSSQNNPLQNAGNFTGVTGAVYASFQGGGSSSIALETAVSGGLPLLQGSNLTASTVIGGSIDCDQAQ